MPANRVVMPANEGGNACEYRLNYPQLRTRAYYKEKGVYSKRASYERRGKKDVTYPTDVTYP
jgi:hypothetical protein